MVSALAPATSAVLLDPEYGAAQAVGGNVLPGGVGLIVAVEETGYTGKPDARQCQVLPGWSVEKARLMGASGVKLLVYYHPQSKLAKPQRDLISAVAETCTRLDVAFFLEPLVYSIDPHRPKLSPTEHRQAVIETTRELGQLGADVLKVEFPIDVQAQPDETIWLQACREVSAASPVPWVLLSAGVDFDIFQKQVVVACTAGASGVMAGRAVWKEAAGLEGVQRARFLRQEAALRLNKLGEICDRLARSWIEFYPPDSLPEGWYLSYPKH
ncbi:MAG: tagatose 1,6-diphosphate aldolase [Anaerolineaceae bacterium]|nr:tagatose 1,6-diphosphate aldolase [Anaerolineaceae bacterium]